MGSCMELEDYKKLSNKELTKRITKLKKEKNAVILAHSYQNLNIHHVADIVGDSLKLAQEAAKTKADIILFCGVDFMAESAKILSPEKKVLIPDTAAKCPMAAMCNGVELRELKEQNPEAVVISYVNSSAEVKAESDCICTSANAVDIVDHYKDRKIIFAPDKNLGSYCMEKTGADIILWNGYCYVHEEFSTGDVYIAKAEHPDCLLLVHPESPMEVLELADFIGSTSQIMDFVEDNIAEMDDKAGVLIGTEIEIAKILQSKYPDKRIYPLADHAVCKDMKRSDLYKICYTLEHEANEVELDEDIRLKALKALDRMLELSK